MDEFKDRLVQSMAAGGINQPQLAALMRVSPQAVQAWCAGKYQPERERIPELAGHLNVDAGWLFLGDKARGSIRAPTVAKENLELQSLYRADRNVEIPRERSLAVKDVPLISWTRAGAWDEAVDPFAPGEADHWIPVTQQVGPNAFALTVRGDSMEPEFAEGTVIIVDPSQKAKSGNYVVARVDEWDETTFKRYVVESGIPYLKPLNPAYRMQQVPVGTKIVGVVVAQSFYKKY